MTVVRSSGQTRHPSRIITLPIANSPPSICHVRSATMMNASRESSIQSRPCRTYSESSTTDSTYSAASTAPTDYGDHYYSDSSKKHAAPIAEHLPPTSHYGAHIADPRSSVETYASTIASLDNLPDANDDAVQPRYSDHDYHSLPRPTTPYDFGKLFPSSRRLHISHDDSTIDGNMNLTVTTDVQRPDRSSKRMILYHLRIYDIEKMALSLRRYHRDSGREVCHARPTQPTLTGQASSPIPQSSPGTSFRRMLSRFSRRTTSSSSLPTPPTSPSIPSLSRQSTNFSTISSAPSASPTTLSFTNYSHVTLFPPPNPSTPSHTFEYWGTTYRWTKHVLPFRDPSSSHPTAMLELCAVTTRTSNAGGKNTNARRPLAVIGLELCSDDDLRRERRRGGWVMPCALELRERVADDLADVIVATGLCAVLQEAARSRGAGWAAGPLR